MGEGGREMEEDKAKLKHCNIIILPCQKNSIFSQRFSANSSERMEFFCAGHMPSLTYLSTIRKYYSTSSTSSYISTCWHVGNSRKWHDIYRPKMEQEEKQMLPNVGPIFSNMSPTCCPTRQCRVKIANADIRQTQLSCVANPLGLGTAGFVDFISIWQFAASGQADLSRWLTQERNAKAIGFCRYRFSWKAISTYMS